MALGEKSDIMMPAASANLRLTNETWAKFRSNIFGEVKFVSLSCSLKYELALAAKTNASLWLREIGKKLAP